MGWDTAKMVRTTPGGAVGTNKQIQNLGGAMNATGTPIYAPAAQPTNTFGSGITMPQPHASSSAIAGFANLPPQQPNAPALPQMQAPQAAPMPPSVAGRPGGQVAARNNWWNAVAANAAPPGPQAPTQPGYDQYVPQFNAMQDFARQQGATESDVNAYGSRLNYQGLNTYGGGDPAQGYAQWQAEEAKRKQAEMAAAAAGSTNWVSQPGR